MSESSVSDHPSRTFDRRAVVVVVARFWRNPVAAVRRWRWSLRYPRPDDLDQMGTAEFDSYVRGIGFDARITAALAESDEIVSQARSDGVVSARERPAEA